MVIIRVGIAVNILPVDMFTACHRDLCRQLIVMVDVGSGQESLML